MGNFTNTQYLNTINSLVSASETKLNNPYYKFSDKKPTPVNYYKQNIKKSTLDCASELHYAHVSKQSALKYNKILDFYLYGIDRITVDYDITDNGVESSPITGEAIVLPNTIEPLPGDFFAITYLKEDVLFKVNSVTPDTLDTGATIYKIEYQLELSQASDQIESQVVSTYKFIVDNVGTEFNCLITSEDFDLASLLSNLISELCTYFNSIFYKSRVQTFIYKYNDTWNFYDPFMIEFLRRNKILSNGDKFFYVAHQTTPEVTFPYEYSKTFFYALEKGDKSLIKSNTTCTADLITDINSLFTSRLEDYYEVKYVDNMPYKTRFNIFADEMISGIKDDKSYGCNDNSIYNIITAYMNGKTDYIDSSIIDQIHKFDYKDNITNFYLIPIYIFIIRNYINGLMNKSTTNNTNSVEV